MDIWFINVKLEERDETVKFLKDQGAEGVSVMTFCTSSSQSQYMRHEYTSEGHRSTTFYEHALQVKKWREGYPK